MASGIYIPMAGAVAQSDALDVTANNLANANTTGFRAERATFSEILGKARGNAPAANDSHFVAMSRTAPDLTPGIVNKTDNPLDVAIDGDGLIALETTRGVRYTRDGRFHLDPEGRLVSADGQSVRGTNGGPIVAGKDTEDVEISADGTVTSDGRTIGQIELVRFPANALKHEGRNQYVASGAPIDDGKTVKLIPEALEGSNVNPVQGIVELIRVSRNYESLHRMIEANKEMDDRAARGIGNG